MIMPGDDDQQAHHGGRRARGRPDDALGISMRHLDAEGGNGDAVVQPVREVVPRGEQGIGRRSVRVAGPLPQFSRPIIAGSTVQ